MAKTPGQVFLVPLEFWQLASKMLTSKNESTQKKQKLLVVDGNGVSPDDDDYFNETS